MSQLDRHLGPLLGRAHEAHRRAAAHELAGLGLSPKGYGALLVLSEHGPLSQRRLGALQGVDRTTTVGVVDALEAAGYVRRTRDPADRRANLIEATVAGRRVLGRGRAAVLRAEDAFLGELDDADRRALMDILRRLVETHARPRQEGGRAETA